jgi:HSP20 family protein
MHQLIKVRFLRDWENLEERVRRWMDMIFEFNEAAPSFRPAADLYETAQGLVLRLEVPGVAPGDLSLALAGQELIVRGQRRAGCPQGACRCHQQEMSFGSFERHFLLPLPIDPQGVEAHCLDGILEVHLPRQASRRIPVKAGSEDD